MTDESGTSTSWPTIPFESYGMPLNPIFEVCWPRVELLLKHDFHFWAVSGWFHRGKDTKPVEQGFLNLFVFLESLKFHWLTARGRQVGTGFAGLVNQVIRDLTGYKRSINSLADFRDRIVHEGLTRIPQDDVIPRYFELYHLCAALYLSLLGWTEGYSDMSGWTVKQAKPWWNVADLNALLAGSPSSSVAGVTGVSTSGPPTVAGP